MHNRNNYQIAFQINIWILADSLPSVSCSVIHLGSFVKFICSSADKLKVLNNESGFNLLINFLCIYWCMVIPMSSINSFWNPSHQFLNMVCFSSILFCIYLFFMYRKKFGQILSYISSSVLYLTPRFREHSCLGRILNSGQIVKKANMFLKLSQAQIDTVCYCLIVNKVHKYFKICKVEAIIPRNHLLDFCLKFVTKTS